MSLTELNSCEYDVTEHGLRHAFEADDNDVQVAAIAVQLTLVKVHYSQGPL